MQNEEKQRGDEVDAKIEKRQRETLKRFQDVQHIIYNNIKLIRGLQDPTTDKEKDVVQKHGLRRIQNEREAAFSGELQSSFFLFRGAEVCKFVGKIRLLNGMHGTGIMISERLLMTCHHVFDLGERHCKDGYVKFGTIEPFAGFPRPLEEAEFRLEPEKFFYHSEELDIAIITVAKKAENPRNYPLSKIGFCHNVNCSNVLPGQHVNIIQFPGTTDPQKMILRQNQVVDINEQYVKFVEAEFVQSHISTCDGVDGDAAETPHEYKVFQHFGDTMPGSSGAGCWDDEWHLIGIHHGALLHVNHTAQDASEKNYLANESTTIAAIKRHIQTNITEADPPLEGYNPKKLGKPFEKTSSSKPCHIL